MADDQKPKLTPEELMRMQQLQQMLQQKYQQGAQPQGAEMNQQALGAPKQAFLTKLKPRNLFISFLQSLQGGVKFVDQFIDLVMKRDGGKAGDVMKSARSPILFGTFIMILFVFVGGIWAATAPLDSAAVAIGTVVSKSKKKAVNHNDGGIVETFFVKLGDEVQVGDKLLEFDDKRVRSEYENILNQYRTFLAAESRLLAEINNDEKVEYPTELTGKAEIKEIAKILSTQDNLFHSKRELHKAERDSLHQRIKQNEKEIEGQKATIKAREKSLAVIKERVESNSKLNEKGYVQKAALLEMEAKQAEIEGQLAVAEASIAKVEQEIIRTEIELINLDSKYSNNTFNELKETQINLIDKRERLFQLQEALNRIILRSPVDGIVNNINYHTVGSLIPAGQTIVEISPKHDALVIDAKIPPKNIDSIRIGLKSKIRFSAFKSRTTPLFTGEVVSLSPDIVTDERGMAMQGQNPELAGGYYLARIELDMNEFEKLAGPRKLELHPGMQAEVQIVTGTRTLLQYLLDPVVDAMFKGFKEK